MKNEQRKRLVELIMESVGGCARNWAETIADYLLENNVVVLTCKVGDTVYVLHNTYERIELGLSDCIYQTVIESIHISGVIEYRMRYKKIVSPDCDFFTAKDIGKTVFLTKEEAEKELERSKQ